MTKFLGDDGTFHTLASGDVGGALLSANNLADVASASAARGNLGLGSAALLTAGAAANNAVQLDGSARLPAVDGSQLTNLSSSGTLVGYNAYGASQTVAIPAGATRAFVRLWGGAGGGCGAALSISCAGAGGGYLEKLLAPLTPGNTLALTIGGGGSAGTSGAGGSGGSSTLASGSQPISTLTAGGGAGGSTGATPPAAGSGSGGDLNIPGQAGLVCTWDGNNGTPQFSTVPGGMTGGGVGRGGQSAGRSGSSSAGDSGGCTIMWFK